MQKRRIKEFKDFVAEAKAGVTLSVGDYVGIVGGDYGEVFNITENDVFYDSVKEGVIRLASKEEVFEAKDAFDRFFMAALKKFDKKANSPDDLDKATRKKFFNYVDKNWNAQNESRADDAILGKELSHQEIIKESIDTIPEVVGVEVVSEKDSRFNGTQIQYRVDYSADVKYIDVKKKMTQIVNENEGCIQKVSRGDQFVLIDVNVKVNQSLDEESPPDPKLKKWLEDPKVQKEFKKQYGDRYKEVMFAKAWKDYKAKK